MSWWNFLLLVVAVAIAIVIAGHCQFLMQSGTGRIDGIPVYVLPSIRSTAVVAVFQASRRIIPHHTFMVALVFATLVLLCFVTITSCWSELQRCKQYKEEKENAKVVHDSFAMIWLVWRLTLKDNWMMWKWTDFLYPYKAVIAKSLKLFWWMIYTRMYLRLLWVPVAKDEIHEI